MSEDSATSDQIDDLVASYRSARPTYEAFVDNIGTLLVSLLRSEGVEHLPIERRTKTVESFRAKLIRPEKDDKYEALTDMTDLAGIRIVAYYEKDVDRICEIIRSNFSIDEVNSTDKTSIIDPDRFGYLSKHFVVRHGERRRDLPENVQFETLKAEIQVRTVVQHAWAVIDRRLRYNNQADIPRKLRRKLFRISALLELADKEFSEVDTAVGSLRAQYEKDVRSGALQIEINQDSVEVFLESSPTIANLRSIATKKMDLEVTTDPSGLTGLVETITVSGLTSIEQVDESLRSKKNIEAKLLAFKKVRGGKIVSIASLTRICLILSLPKNKANEVLQKRPFLNVKTNAALQQMVD
jgi:GTP pyrophosphokinase